MYGVQYYDTTCHSYLWVWRDGTPLTFPDRAAADAYITAAELPRAEYWREPAAAVGCPRFHYHAAPLPTEAV